MANGKKVIHENISELGFIEQANALIDESYAVVIEDSRFGHGINIRDHKLLVSLMNLHVSHVNDILVEKYTDKIVEHYGPIMNAIDRIEKNQKSGQEKIDKSINKITTKINKLEARIDRLENNFNLIFEEHLKNHKPKAHIKL